LQSHLLKVGYHFCASMVAGPIQQKDSVLAPVWRVKVQLLDQGLEKNEEHLTVSVSLGESKPNTTFSVNCRQN
jgi:hypothetical protein